MPVPRIVHLDEDVTLQLFFDTSARIHAYAPLHRSGSFIYEGDDSAPAPRAIMFGTYAECLLYCNANMLDHLAAFHDQSVRFRKSGEGRSSVWARAIVFPHHTVIEYQGELDARTQEDPAKQAARERGERPTAKRSRRRATKTA